MYLSSTLWYLTWPVLIIIAYQVVKLVVKKYEARLKAETKTEE